VDKDFNEEWSLSEEDEVDKIKDSDEDAITKTNKNYLKIINHLHKRVIEEELINKAMQKVLIYYELVDEFKDSENSRIRSYDSDSNISDEYSTKMEESENKQEYST